MRNLIGEDINLVELDDELKAINQAAMEEVKA
jgi:hypothetical protein